MHSKKRRIWPYILLTVVLILGVAGVWGYKWISSLNPADLLGSDFVREFVVDEIGGEVGSLVTLLPELAGIDEPKTYLFLFLNNTEMRPGGGFIGSYATVRVSGGEEEFLVLEGSERLDARTPEDWTPVPPRPITEHLGVDRWYFRDSNWSPDFAESSEKTLELYAAEGGVAADEIDVVVGVTPTVLEELLRIIGPVTVQGMTFTAENVTETLEYEVEYGYADRGISFADRKQIMGFFAAAIAEQIRDSVFSFATEYLDLAIALLQQEHIVLYSVDPTLQQSFVDAGIAGEVAHSDGDSLLWVDANLAALKTDHAMERTLHYSIEPQEDGRFLATARMEYVHTGGFDWRTSRYRTYARVYVPQGSELVTVDGSMKTDRSTEPGVIDLGLDLGKQWFGTFISIEPGETKSLTFQYLLPESVGDQIDAGLYTLFVQKQIGTLDHALTLDLDFGTTITAADPAEDQSEWGDARYVLDSDLVVDRSFGVSFE